MSDTRLISLRVPVELLSEADRVSSDEDRSRAWVLLRWLRVGCQGELGGIKKFPDVKTPLPVVPNSFMEPEVSMDAVRQIAAGHFQAVVEREGKYPDVGGEIEMCGHRELNPVDGEMYACRLPKHPKKVKHEPGERVEA